MSDKAKEIKKEAIAALAKGSATAEQQVICSQVLNEWGLILHGITTKVGGSEKDVEGNG